MNWKLFWLCGVIYVSMLISAFLGASVLSSILFWIFLILVVLNFLYTVRFVLKKNKDIAKDKIERP